MSFRDTIKALPLRRPRTSKRTTSSDSKTSRSSTSTSSSSTHDSTMSYQPPLGYFQDECPEYHAIFCSQQFSDEHESLTNTNTNSRAYLEEILESADLECHSDGAESPPQYTALDNGNKKPRYSRRDRTRTPSQTAPTPDAASALAHPSDRTLCLRCNARRLKAWYLRKQQEHDER
jgi:hypothetical protein